MIKPSNFVSNVSDISWRIRPEVSNISSRSFNKIATARHVTRAESSLASKTGVEFENFLHNFKNCEKNKINEKNNCNSKTGKFKEQYSKIDWLHASFPVICEFDENSAKPQEQEYYIEFCDDLADYFIDNVLSKVLPQVKRFSYEITSGLFGFKRGKKIFAEISDELVHIGSLVYGGKSQRQKMMFQLLGRGCGLVQDWQVLKDELEDLRARITRIDLAVDFLDGEFTVDDVLTLYNEGKFINRGRNPSLDLHGAWHELGVEGRTVYVGKKKNGKCLCAYEKGKQLGIKDSKWVRYEVRVTSTNRVVPLDALINSDEYFRGSYPALEFFFNILGWSVIAKSISVIKKETESSLASGLYHLRRCYGKYLNQAILITDCKEKDLVNILLRRGIPKSMDPYCVDFAYLSFENLKQSLREKQFYG